MATTRTTPVKAPAKPRVTKPKPVLTEKEQHQADIDYLAKELFKEAKKHELCDEFKAVMNRVNKNLNVKMPEDVINPKLTYSMPTITLSLGGSWVAPTVKLNGYGDTVLNKATKDAFDKALRAAVDAFLAGYAPLTGAFKDVKVRTMGQSSYLYEED